MPNSKSKRGEVQNDSPPLSLIQKTADYVRGRFAGEGSGHDWWHVWRVWQNARMLAAHENVNSQVVELAALFHDIADWKFNGGDDSEGPKAARKWLESLNAEESVIQHVSEIIQDMSFKGAGVSSTMRTNEGKVVQDADRLDAIGAIGIARTFAYGGSRGREMYNPEIKPGRHETFEHYKKNQGPTINHFYEKLLLLKNLMNTQTARRMAEARHQFMEEFLRRFFQEWEGK